MQVWILILDPRWLSQRWCHIIMPSRKTRFSHHDVVLNDNASSCSMATLDDTGQTFRSSSDFVETIIDTDYQGSASSWSTGSKFRQSTANTWIQAVMKLHLKDCSEGTKFTLNGWPAVPTSPKDPTWKRYPSNAAQRVTPCKTLGDGVHSDRDQFLKIHVALYVHMWWRNLKSFFTLACQHFTRP